MERAANILGGFGIVVAGDPDPVAATLQGGQTCAIASLQPRRTAAVMETVAERDHRARRVMRDQTRQPRQRGGRVIRRQELAARGVARAFFQMQVGDNKHAVLGPIQRASGICDQRNASHGDVALPRRHALHRNFQFIASLISSSAASASNASDASP